MCKIKDLIPIIIYQYSYEKQPQNVDQENQCDANGIDHQFFQIVVEGIKPQKRTERHDFHDA
jgi:hypothetical protein